MCPIINFIHVPKSMSHFFCSYPKEFKESFWNLGIRDIVVLLVRWDMLLWDPFLSDLYWDIKNGKLERWNVSDGVEKLRWNTPVIDFVLELEGAGEDPSENLMSYLIFNVS